MKEPSPLVPQGSFEAQARSKSRVKLAFYTIVAIHVLAIGGFLIIGCKRDDKDAMAEITPPPTNDLAVVPPIGSDPTVTTPALTGAPPTAAPSALPGVTGVTPPTPPTNTTVVADIPPAAMIEHVVVKNDNFSTIATKYGVTVKAIQVANPNLNPTRLQIGDKVKIPPKTAVTTTAPAPAADAGLYTVKSGDTLSKIAAMHKTTIKELQQLNNLPTTQIKVGQKLKVPQPAASPAPGGTPPPAQ